MQAQLICNEAIIAVVNREKQPSHAIYSSDAAARVAHLRAPRNRQFSPGKYYRWQFSGVNIAIVRSKHSYFFFVIIIMAGGEHYVWHAHIFSVSNTKLKEVEGICINLWEVELHDTRSLASLKRTACWWFWFGLVLGALLAFAHGVGPLLLGLSSADFAQDDDNKGS